jgi:hypothetical protein
MSIKSPCWVIERQCALRTVQWFLNVRIFFRGISCETPARACGNLTLFSGRRNMQMCALLMVDKEASRANNSLKWVVWYSSNDPSNLTRWTQYPSTPIYLLLSSRWCEAMKFKWIHPNKKNRHRNVALFFQHCLLPTSSARYTRR